MIPHPAAFVHCVPADSRGIMVWGDTMKLFIVGIVASGKTTLARQLSVRTGVPCYEGDQIAWGFPGEARHKRSPAEQEATIRRIDAAGDWIVEGTDRQAQRILWELADVILFLDPPLRVRLRRIVLRWLRQRLGLEPCNYRPTVSMLRAMFRWTREFEQNRAAFERQLAQYGGKVRRAASTEEALAICDECAAVR